MRSHERAAEVGLAGIDRTRGTQQEEAVVGLGSQREDRGARVGVDEDLVPGGGAQRRAPLTQRVGRAYEAHCVDRVVHEGTMRGMRRVEPGVGMANRVGVPAGIRAGPIRQSILWRRHRLRAAMLVEVREDDRAASAS